MRKALAFVWSLRPSKREALCMAFQASMILGIIGVMALTLKG